MRSHLVLAAGLLLSSCLPMEAQTPLTPIVLAQRSPSLTMNLFRASLVGLSLTALPVEPPGEPLPHLSFPFYKEYKPEPSLESRLPIEEIQTSFLKESNFLVAHLWRGIQLDMIDSTLQVGAPRSGIGFQDIRPSSHDQAGVASSVGIDGISLRYSFGRGAETRKPIQIWRCVLWVMGKNR